MLVHFPGGRQEVDHLLDCDARRLGQIDVRAHADEVRAGFGARPGQRHALADGELHLAAERGLESGLVDLAIALRGMSVANLEQGARHVHGNPQRGAGDQFLVIEITGVNAGRSAADAALCRRRRHAHAAEERPERNGGAHERGGHRLPIHLDDGGPAARDAVLADESAATVVAVRDRQVDRQQLDLQCIARLGAGDEHRAGQDVSARAAVGHFLDDGAQGGLDVGGGHAGLLEAIRHRCQQRVDIDNVAGCDGQDRLGLGPIVSVGDGGGCGFQAVGLRGLGGGRDAQQAGQGDK